MLSLIYITFRENCQFQWTFDALVNQVPENLRSSIQLVIVDGMLQHDETALKRRQAFKDIIGDTFDYVHVEPKPTPWQGRYRTVSKDHFAASNTRNTGACYAKYSYLVFIDDLGVLSETWFAAVLTAQKENIVQAGAFKKMKGLVVEKGRMVKGDNANYNDVVHEDHRLKLPQYSREDEKNLSCGGHLYGSSFGIPKAVYFAVNGQNEMFDGMGYEDCDLGIRLERSGVPIYYHKRMLIYENYRQLGSDNRRDCKRADPVPSEDEYKALLKEYNFTDRYGDGPKGLSHFMNNYSHQGPLRTNPNFSLQAYNKAITVDLCDPAKVQVFKKPNDKEIHFFTKRPLKDGIWILNLIYGMNNYCYVFVMIPRHTGRSAIHANPFVINLVFGNKFIKCFQFPGRSIEPRVIDQLVKDQNTIGIQVIFQRI